LQTTAMSLAQSTPQPRQYIGRHDGDSRSGGDSGKSLLRAGFSMCEGIATDHNADQACGLGNRSGEQSLNEADTPYRMAKHELRVGISIRTGAGLLRAQN